VTLDLVPNRIPLRAIWPIERNVEPPTLRMRSVIGSVIA